MSVALDLHSFLSSEHGFISMIIQHSIYARRTILNIQIDYLSQRNLSDFMIVCVSVCFFVYFHLI